MEDVGRVGVAVDECCELFRDNATGEFWGFRPGFLRLVRASDFRLQRLVFYKMYLIDSLIPEIEGRIID